MKRSALLLMIFALFFGLGAPIAEARSPRGAYYEGLREIGRERREMRRDILNAGSRREARAAYYEGMREIRRERREMRRDIRRSLQRERFRRRWDYY